MEVELTDHLGYEPHAEPPGGIGDTRNGTRPKRLVGEHGEVQIDAPRDRDGSFGAKIVRKRQRRFEVDDKILALYSRGLSSRDISAHLEEIYGVQVGRDLIARACRRRRSIPPGQSPTCWSCTTTGKARRGT